MKKSELHSSTLADQPLLSLQQSQRIAGCWGDSSGLQVQVYKGRLISLYVGETQRGHTEGSCLDRLERCCLPFLPSHWLFLLMLTAIRCSSAQALPTPITGCWPSPAWSVFWFCVPTPGFLLQGGPESLPACSQLIPDVRQL